MSTYQERVKMNELKEKKPIFTKIKNLFCKKQVITEEMNIQEEWYKEAEKIRFCVINPKKDLFKFIKKLVNNYQHDYGTICHAITASALATINAINNTEQGHITGAQAGCIMWGIITKFMCKKGALKLLEYDNMLYPQYKSHFDKTISKETFADLQEKAKKLLDTNGEKAHNEVRLHWIQIINGYVPFGYKIKEDE